MPKKEIPRMETPSGRDDKLPGERPIRTEAPKPRKQSKAPKTTKQPKASKPKEQPKTSKPPKATAPEAQQYAPKDQSVPTEVQVKPKSPVGRIPLLLPAAKNVDRRFIRGVARPLNWKRGSIYVKHGSRLPSFGMSMIAQISPVFCIPGNKELLNYYNRVDDRLYKIRNCMNIKGEKRQLALFAPEIDPNLMVRMKAAGLSLEDVLGSGSGNLPPYRFLYILEKAKAFTAVVQNFGAALLSAMEKRDAEEMAQLRTTQEQHILSMTTRSRQLEIDSAGEQIKTLEDRRVSLEYQIAYYEGLISERITKWEVAQSVGRHAASIIRGTEATALFTAGMLSLIPKVGSPFAMTYGGQELGGSMGKIAFAMGSLANLGDNMAASAGLEAGFERRSEGWEHQKKVLEYELLQNGENLEAAKIRKEILIEAQKIHRKNIAHNEEVIEFYEDKFSGLGLYTWMSITMQRLFKEAFKNALSIARLAEQAYRFERFERNDTTVFIDGNYFESSKAGLLAGEKLAMALQTMEMRYLETNYRKNEIRQAFSLTQLNPAALLKLKQTGSCAFSIPERFFDLFYPGQYRRLIKSVSLSIPCVTGPYTNVSATLSLKGSDIRRDPDVDAGLIEVPKSRTTTMATSTAQNDAGVFELNFRDDRYMPFEGAGAISSWKLSLPKNFRQFNYNTINDVIIHVSYTAEYDALFRDKIEGLQNEAESALLKAIEEKPFSRIFSFRHEFANEFHSLTRQGINETVTFDIQDKHFPIFMNGKDLEVAKARLILVTPSGGGVNGVEIVINNTPQNGFSKDSDFGDLYATGDIKQVFAAGDIRKTHTIAVASGGDLVPAASSDSRAVIDREKLEDIVLYIEYKMA